MITKLAKNTPANTAIPRSRPRHAPIAARRILSGKSLILRGKSLAADFSLEDILILLHLLRQGPMQSEYR